MNVGIDAIGVYWIKTVKELFLKKQYIQSSVMAFTQPSVSSILIQPECDIVALAEDPTVLDVQKHSTHFLYVIIPHGGKSILSKLRAEEDRVLKLFGSRSSVHLVCSSPYWLSHVDKKGAHYKLTVALREI